MDVKSSISSLNELGGVGSQSYVVRGAKTSCSKGTCPSQLNIPLCHGVYLKDKPQLTIMDHRGMVNILPFGACKRSHTPPCVPSISGPWIRGKENVLIEGHQALLNTSTNFCLQGGIITITDDGQE